MPNCLLCIATTLVHPLRSCFEMLESVICRAKAEAGWGIFCLMFSFSSNESLSFRWSYGPAFGRIIALGFILLTPALNDNKQPLKYLKAGWAADLHQIIFFYVEIIGLTLLITCNPVSSFLTLVLCLASGIRTCTLSTAVALNFWILPALENYFTDTQIKSQKILRKTSSLEAKYKDLRTRLRLARYWIKSYSLHGMILFFFLFACFFGFVFFVFFKKHYYYFK